MPEKTLFIEIFQPFAQYRNPLTFYYAQTYPLPPKSTIIGMLQNAVNDYYGHNYGIEKWWNLKISVHGGFETVFWNYQQLIKGDVSISIAGLINKHDRNPLGNIWHRIYNSSIKAQRTPVYQQELFNGHLYLFIKGEENLIDEIKVSLEKTKKILSLGRSEDIIYIRKISEILNSEIKQKEAKKSLWLTYPTYLKEKIELYGNKKEFPIKNQKYPVYSIPTFVIFHNNGIPVKNKAEITKETKRDVKFETVIYTGFDYVLKLSEPVKFEEFVNDNKKFRIISDFGWL